MRGRQAKRARQERAIILTELQLERYQEELKLQQEEVKLSKTKKEKDKWLTIEDQQMNLITSQELVKQLNKKIEGAKMTIQNTKSKLA
tara:strand:- start:317 stop:580 length:264 start_codon:yes stop_codon:yes gene_type:complete